MPREADRPAHFSRHAGERVAQRSRLSCFEIAMILEARAYVGLGTKPGINREHLLFYSPPDEAFFVLLRDTIDGTVVTVLPLEYHERLAWAVSPAALASARTLAAQRSHSTASRTAPAVIRISVHYLDAAGKQKTALVEKLDAARWRQGLAQVVKAHLTRDEVADYARRLGVPYAAIYGLSLRLGKHGAPLVVDPPSA